tara:strand:- start:2462 stop:2833 length:372 start_codon:yes stop_codon:yes gene_type:complete
LKDNKMPTIRVMTARTDLLEIPELVAQEYNKVRRKPDAILVRNDGFSQLLYHAPDSLTRQVQKKVENATVSEVAIETYNRLIATTGFSGSIKFRPIGLETMATRLLLAKSPEWCTMFYFETIK